MIVSVLIALAAVTTKVPEVTPPIQVQQRVAPVLEAYADLLRKGENPASEDAVGIALLAVLRDQSEVGDEALAVLLGLYVGDHSAEDIVCELVNRGKRGLGYLAKYQSAQVRMPSVSAPMPKSVKALYPSVVSRIKSGQTCVEEP